MRKASQPEQVSCDGFRRLMFTIAEGAATLQAGRLVRPNPAPQADAREAAHFGQTLQSRAAGRER